MAKIFVGHSGADHKYVDKFVNEILKLGCEVRVRDIFYSSLPDTGVPSGEDLNHYVRERVAEGSLVIAIITPAFQSSQYCVAELGAAWSRAGNLLPLLGPNMERSDLEGVLNSVIIKPITDSAALDEVKQRVGRAVGHTSLDTTWGVHKEKWLANKRRYARLVTTPLTVTPAELATARAELDAARAALSEALDRVAELEEENDALAELKDEEEVAAVRLPRKEVEQFQFYAEDARDRLRDVSDAVEEALRYRTTSSALPWPDNNNDYNLYRSAEESVDDGTLSDNEDGTLSVNTGFTAVKKAAEAVDRLQDFFNGSSPEFDSWFTEEYDGPPDLSARLVWRALFH